MFKNISSIPFIGSKWRYRNKIFNIISNDDFFKDKLNNNFIFIDVFGGSGALTLIFKEIFKNSTFIFNDYDRIITNDLNENIIDETIKKGNEIIKEIKENVQTMGHNVRFTKEEEDKINDILKKYKKDIEDDSQLRHIIESQLVFNCRNLDLNKKNNYFSRFKKSNNENYFKNFDKVKIIHKSSDEIFKNIDKFNKYNVIFILDPPYLNYQMKNQYKTRHWTFKQYLNMLEKTLNYKCIYFEDQNNSLDNIFDFISNISTKINYNIHILENKKGKQDIMLIKY